MNRHHPTQSMLAAAILLSSILLSCATLPIAQRKLLASDGSPGDFFGYSVALSGDTALIGAFNDDDERGIDVGSAYVFTRIRNSWTQQARLTAIDGVTGDTFGGNLALSDDIAVIGAIRDDDRGENSGSVYVFRRVGDDWSHHTKVVAVDGAEGDAFGQAIALANGVLVVGAPHDDDRGDSSGSVYVFKRIGPAWRQDAKLTASDGSAGDVFGISVALSKDTIVVGADLNDEIAPNAGAAYVFTRSESGWKQQAKLTAADGAEADIFGVRVALAGDTALISARRDDDEVMGKDAGSAYVFVRDATTWRQQAKLIAPDGAADDRFGRSVALVDDTAVVGAMFQDEKGENSGAVYVFTRSGEAWALQAKRTAADGAADSVFGWSVATSRNLALVGAARNNEKGDEAGAAYILNIPVNSVPDAIAR